MQYITSTQNPHIKELVRLTNSKKERGLSGLFVMESVKLATEAVQAGVEIHTLLATQRAWEHYQSELQAVAAAAAESVCISEEVSDKLSTAVTGQGVYCLCAMPAPKLQPEKLPARGRYLLLSSLQDPGNIGTILRAGLAFGIDGVLLSADCPDLYSPKVLRAAMGAVFRLPMAVVPDLADCIAKMRERGIRVYGAALDRTAVTVEEAALGDGCAVVIGNEGRGLSPQLLSACDGSVFIPISEASESLNAAIAASILLWEMRR